MRIHKDLGTWFGLSYASFCVMPRVLMEDMPETWQQRMAELLHEFDHAFDGHAFTELTGIDGWQVRATARRKLVSIPSSLKNYRHPEMSFIQKIRHTRYWKAQDYLARRRARKEGEPPQADSSPSV